MSKNKRRGRINDSQQAKPSFKIRAKKSLVDPVMAQALSNGAQLSRGTFETQAVPNPHGEVLKDGIPIRHLAVRSKPQYELLKTRKVITPSQAAALAWYSDRLGLADSGMLKNPLAGNGGGGSVGAGIPISEARMGAVHDVDWARDVILEGGEVEIEYIIPGRRKGDEKTVDRKVRKRFLTREMLAVFDTVMVDEATFVGTARQEWSNGHVRISKLRRERELSALFAEASRRVDAAHAARYPRGPRGILFAGDHPTMRIPSV